MPVHGEFRMLAAHASSRARPACPRTSIVLAENGAVVELSRDAASAIVDQVEAGRDVRRRARRRRRRTTSRCATGAASPRTAC